MQKCATGTVTGRVLIPNKYRPCTVHDINSVVYVQDISQSSQMFHYFIYEHLQLKQRLKKINGHSVNHQRTLNHKVLMVDF